MVERVNLDISVRPNDFSRGYAGKRFWYLITNDKGDIERFPFLLKDAIVDFFRLGNGKRGINSQGFLCSDYNSPEMVFLTNQLKTFLLRRYNLEEKYLNQFGRIGIHFTGGQDISSRIFDTIESEIIRDFFEEWNYDIQNGKLTLSANWTFCSGSDRILIPENYKLDVRRLDKYWFPLLIGGMGERGSSFDEFCK